MNEHAPINETHELHKEIKAAQALRASLETLTDDEDTIRDTLEGETSLHELIAQVLASMDDDQLIVDGCNERISDLQERRTRVKNRIEAKRTMILQAMSIGDVKTIEAPLATASVKNVPPSVVVNDEAEIPADFWTPQDPKLDKKSLLAALKDKQTIPGATLSNGGTTLSIRRK